MTGGNIGGAPHEPMRRICGLTLPGGALALLLCLAILGCASSSSQSAQTAAALPPAPGAPSQTFTEWVASFRQAALAHGISPATYDQAFTGVTVKPKIITADQNQPEFEQRIWTYLAKAVSNFRIQKGQDLLKQHAELFHSIEKTYGVQPQNLVAVWGLESSFGAFIGDINVIEALATLSYQGRRRDFGRQQLLAALEILDKGYATTSQLKGSWAGAMGHTQFIPTTYLSYAVDYDGDKRRDVWSNLGDVFASTANFLEKSGWQKGNPWGREVILPSGFDFSLADKTIVKSVASWAKMGVTASTGNNLNADKNQTASLILPGGHTGPAFLIYQNFRTLLRYNNSTSYALAAALLADRLIGGRPLKGAWPTEEQPLSRLEREELQRKLNAMGYDAGAVDGILGARTRAALRMFQKDMNMPADGFATIPVLMRVRQSYVP